MKNIFLLSFCLFLFLGACDEIMPVIPDPPEAGERVVLMEEFSGGKCVPCSDAAKLIDEISSQYGESFVPITIHTFMGGQSDPYDGAKYDFRTEEGQQLVEFLGMPAGIPAGVINRKKFDGQDGLQSFKSKWNSLVQTAIAEESNLNIGLDLAYDSDSRNLTINATMIPQAALSGDIRLIAVIVESDLIDKQAIPEGDGVDPAFQHNHILRDVITPVTGESLGETLPALTPVNKTIEYTIPEDVDGLDWWIPANMEVVVYVVNNTSDSKEVLQAASGHFTE